MCKFKWHFIRQIVGQGEQHRRVYRAQLGAQEARAGGTNGCTELNLAVLAGVQGTERRSRGQGELHRWAYRAQRGAEESRESCTDGCTDHKEALKRPGRAAQTGVQGTKRRPRTPKLAPKRLQVAIQERMDS